MVRSAGVLAWLVLAGAVALATDAYAERQPYERYQSIVDRQMFGPLPVGFDPSKSPAEVSKSGSAAAEKELTKEQEKVKSAIRFSVINVTPQGETAIGFTDNSDPKAPVHYYLKVGESRGGWEVKEADAKAATMTIAKDGVEVSLSLGGDSAKDGTTQAAQPAATTAADAASKRRSPMLTTLGSRRRARQEREEADQLAAAKREEERKAREEERARRDEEEKAQREAEREEQRRQLQQIQEELRKAREERQAQEREKEAANGGEESNEET